MGMEMDSDDEEDEEEVGERIKTEEAENLYVPRNQFIDCIEQKTATTTKKNKLHYLADRLLEEGKGQGENLVLGDIEDYVLGFR